MISERKEPHLADCDKYEYFLIGNVKAYFSTYPEGLKEL